MKNWLQILSLIVCIVLLIMVIAQGRQLEAYQQSMEERIDALQFRMFEEIAKVSNHIDAALEEQNRLVKDFSLEPAGIDREKKSLSVLVSLSLKEWYSDAAVSLAADIAGESQIVSMVSDGQGSYTAQLLLPLERDRELSLNARILSDGRTRQEELGAWGDIAMLLPLQNSGGGWSGPEFMDGVMSSNFTIYLEGRDGKTVSVREPRFLVYRNGELVQTLDAVDDPFSDTAQGYAFTVDTQGNRWQLECEEGDMIDIRFRCYDEFGLGYDFLFMTWATDQDDMYPEDGAGFQSGSSELELFWE